MMELGKYSFGIGDRFAHQGLAQLQAFIKAKSYGVEITPVWNKSNREHQTVGSKPIQVRKEAENAVLDLNWKNNFFVDADHITLETVDRFIEYSDFFTIDVAEEINKPFENEALNRFLNNHNDQLGELKIEGLITPLHVTKEALISVGNRFQKAIEKAKEVYDYILLRKGSNDFAVEVSMDEVDEPQSPLELYFILYLLSKHKIPVNTIAPKFTGRFNKGVDYEGDIQKFSHEFEQDILILKHAIKNFGLPGNLKLSVHTGSDKFSLYPIINKIIKKHDVGLHLKTAGTTWLEELIGLAESEGTGLEMAKSIYLSALERYEELTSPYSTVLNIDRSLLPSLEHVNQWNGDQFATTLRHNKMHTNYNPHFRQLLHTAYKIAAEKGKTFTDELTKNEKVISKNVTENIFERHIKPLFL